MSFLRTVLRYFALLLVLSEPAVSRAQDEAVSQLADLLGDIETYQAEVRQLIVESTGGLLEESTIVFKLKRPNGFYWETLAPYPELIVTNGRVLWNYQPDLLQVTLEDWDPAQAELAAQLLNGKIDQINEDYFITGGDVGSGTAFEFILEPVDPSSPYERVTLYFRDRQLSSIHIDNGNGQRTFWEFFEPILNEPIDEAIFEFVAPDDIDVIDNRKTP